MYNVYFYVILQLKIVFTNPVRLVNWICDSRYKKSLAYSDYLHCFYRTQCICQAFCHNIHTIFQLLLILHSVHRVVIES